MLPLVFVSSVTFVVLSSAAKVGGGEGLLRGHVCWVLAVDRSCYGVYVGAG